jgi:molecular chaperone DnaJ
VSLSEEQKELLQKFEQSMLKGGAKHSPRESSWLDGVKKFFSK